MREDSVYEFNFLKNVLRIVLWPNMRSFLRTNYFTCRMCVLLVFWVFFIVWSNWFTVWLKSSIAFLILFWCSITESEDIILFFIYLINACSANSYQPSKWTHSEFHVWSMQHSETNYWFISVAIPVVAHSILCRKYKNGWPIAQASRVEETCLPVTIQQGIRSRVLSRELPVTSTAGLKNFQTQVGYRLFGRGQIQLRTRRPARASRMPSAPVRGRRCTGCTSCAGKGSRGGSKPGPGPSCSHLLLATQHLPRARDKENPGSSSGWLQASWGQQLVPDQSCPLWTQDGGGCGRAAGLSRSAEVEAQPARVSSEGLSTDSGPLSAIPWTHCCSVSLAPRSPGFRAGPIFSSPPPPTGSGEGSKPRASKSWTHLIHGQRASSSCGWRRALGQMVGCNCRAT